jgi:hypothetical protein
MDNIVEIKKAADSIKAIFNAAQTNSLNQMLIDAVTAYHEGLVDEKINADLNALNLVRSEYIFDDAPF